jgi:hypothetical protein
MFYERTVGSPSFGVLKTGLCVTLIHTPVTSCQPEFLTDQRQWWMKKYDIKIMVDQQKFSSGYNIAIFE